MERAAPAAPPEGLRSAREVLLQFLVVEGRVGEAHRYQDVLGEDIDPLALHPVAEGVHALGQEHEVIERRAEEYQDGEDRLVVEPAPPWPLARRPGPRQQDLQPGVGDEGERHGDEEDDRERHVALVADLERHDRQQRQAQTDDDAAEEPDIVEPATKAGVAKARGIGGGDSITVQAPDQPPGGEGADRDDCHAGREETARGLKGAGLGDRRHACGDVVRVIGREYVAGGHDDRHADKTDQ